MWGKLCTERRSILDDRRRLLTDSRYRFGCYAIEKLSWWKPAETCLVLA